MEKKLVKAILDVIKDVKDRPSVYGVQIVAHDNITGGSALYFTNGYVAIKLMCGEYEGLRKFSDNYWVGGKQLEDIYKQMGAKDVYLDVNYDSVTHIDLEHWWSEWHSHIEQTEQMAINPEIFKKLAPFGVMVISLVKKDNGSKLALFSGHGVQAVACPMTNKVEEELCQAK